MIAVETNILVYAHRADAEWHPQAVEAVAALANVITPLVADSGVASGGLAANAVTVLVTGWSVRIA